jgi:CheY-like chemotaxis protein
MRGALILIADDSKLFLEMQKGFLARTGFEVLTAETGRRAVELALQRPPNLILIDLNMPDLDGAATCTAMRRDPKLALLPIIVMSATGSDQIREHCLQAGCTEFVSKPERPDELLGLVARILASRRRKSTRLTVIWGVAGSPGGRQKIGSATDLSSTGLLLVSCVSLEVGAVLERSCVLFRPLARPSRRAFTSSTFLKATRNRSSTMSRVDDLLRRQHGTLA